MSLVFGVCFSPIEYPNGYCSLVAITKILDSSKQNTLLERNQDYGYKRKHYRWKYSTIDTGAWMEIFSLTKS